MSKKQTKTLLILVAVLAVLGIVFAAVKLSARKKEKAAAAKTVVKQESIVSQKVYTAFSWSQNGEKYSFTRQGNVWYWDADKSFPLNANYLTKLANTLNGLTPVQTIKGGDQPAAYGLDKPSITLTATAKDGAKNTFALGSAAVNSDGNYYLMVNGDSSKIYVVETTLHDELTAGILTMMQLPDLPVLQTGDLTSLEVRGTADTLLTAKTAKSGSKTTTAWYADGKNVTKNSAVKQLVSAVSSMTVASAQFYKPTAAQLSQCGLSKPAVVITLHYTDAKDAAQTLTLSVGGAASDGENRYVQISGDSTVYAMTAAKLTELLSVADSGLPSD
jgi:hypothetical protein